MKICFIDTETTSLRPDRRIWDIGIIERHYVQLEDGGIRWEDNEHTWFVASSDLDLGNADPFSLKIGRFYDRHPGYGKEYAHEDQFGGEYGVRPEYDMLRDVEQITRGAYIVGAVPNFDTEVIAARMRDNFCCPSWHYHLIDVENLAAGVLRLPPPWDFDAILAKFELTYNEADRHTAIGDARMARDLYDKVMAPF